MPEGEATPSPLSCLCTNGTLSYISTLWLLRPLGGTLYLFHLGCRSYSLQPTAYHLPPTTYSLHLQPTAYSSTMMALHAYSLLYRVSLHLSMLSSMYKYGTCRLKQTDALSDGLPRVTYKATRLITISTSCLAFSGSLKPMKNDPTPKPSWYHSVNADGN